MDPEHSIAHHKVMAIDGGRAITGSFDFTKAAAENNSENLLVIHDKNWLYVAQRTGKSMPNIQRSVMAEGYGRFPGRRERTRGDDGENNRDFFEVFFWLGKIKGDEG